MISIDCPHCRKPLRIKDELAGKRGKCPSCGETFRTPPALTNPEKIPAAVEAKKARVKKSSGTLTKVLATVFGAVLAPVLVAIIVKWADISLWHAAPAQPAPPQPALIHAAPTQTLPETKPKEEVLAKTPADVVVASMTFVPIPKGTFWMGWDNVLKQSKQVEIKQDFELAAHAVTQEQWQAVMGNNPSRFSRQGGGKAAVETISDADLKRFPVESVSWNDVEEFVEKLNEREKGKGWLYRLPTEAEWEYACRGGATSKEECSFDFYFAKPTNVFSSTKANFRHDPYLGRTTKVGSYVSNKLGLYDMHGNVAQWCDDLYDASGSNRVIRGGSWNDDFRYSGAAAYRESRLPSDPRDDLGFRLARGPTRSKEVVAAEKPATTKLKEEVANKPAEFDLATMKFVRLPKGTFWMGWGSTNKGLVGGARQVEIKQNFELAAYTVTQEQWQALMGNNPSSFSRLGADRDEVELISDAALKRFPVENVSFNDVQKFLKKLNEREKDKGWWYRLPSEAEWEYACRGGATSLEECSFDFYLEQLTNNLSSKQANFNGNNPAGNAEKGPDLGRTTRVGSYAPNKLGLYDMHGNVAQWCNDFFDITSPDRVVRGGSWDSDGFGCQASNRASSTLGNRENDLGFRLARVPSESK